MALADFAEALGQRRDQLWVRGQDVATQEQAFAPGTLNAAGEAARMFCRERVPQASCSSLSGTTSARR
jgi:hypothetical protein